MEQTTFPFFDKTQERDDNHVANSAAYDKDIKIFYCIFLTDRMIRTCLNLIRLFCNPTSTQEAHITVRGPYNDLQITKYPRRWKEKLPSTSIKISGTGCFFEEKQNTVFLPCTVDDIDTIWWKPTFRYLPRKSHITIYDGDSRHLAEQILAILSMHRLSFTTSGSELSPIISLNKDQLNFKVYLEIDKSVCESIFGCDLNIGDIMHIDEHSRLNGIDTVINYMEKALYMSQLTRT